MIKLLIREVWIQISPLSTEIVSYVPKRNTVYEKLNMLNSTESISAYDSMLVRITANRIKHHNKLSLVAASISENSSSLQS